MGLWDHVGDGTVFGMETFSHGAIDLDAIQPGQYIQNSTIELGLRTP